MKMQSKITVRVAGQALPKKQDGTLDLGGIQRNTVKGNDVYGYAEEAMEASVEINAFIGSATDLETIRAASDVTVLATLDSGQAYVLSHAWLETPPKIGEASDGGATPLKFVAVTAEPV